MENATIKEIIIQKLIQENYSIDTIAEALNEIYKKDLEILSFQKRTLVKNIKNIEELLNLTHEEFLKKVNITNWKQNAQDITFATCVKRLLEELKKIIQEKKAQNEEEYLEKNKEKIFNSLVSFIQNYIIKGLKEKIRQSIEKTQNKDNKELNYIRLDLNDKELKLLKQLLTNKIEYKDIIDSPDKFENLKMLKHIKEELEYYLQKIEYKSIVDRTYIIEDMNLDGRDNKTLNQYSISRISDIIEYSIEELSKLPRFGNSICSKLLKFFQEKNIVSLTDRETVLRNLTEENAGIIKRQKVV